MNSNDIDPKEQVRQFLNYKLWHRIYVLIMFFVLFFCLVIFPYYPDKPFTRLIFNAMGLMIAFWVIINFPKILSLTFGNRHIFRIMIYKIKLKDSFYAYKPTKEENQKSILYSCIYRLTIAFIALAFIALLILPIRMILDDIINYYFK